VPRGLASVSAKMAQPPTVAHPSATVKLSNAGGQIAGNADFYALGYTDANDTGGASFDIRAVGMQAFSAPTASNPTRQFIVLAINTWNRWSAAAQNEFDTYVDVNDDGIADYIVIAVDFGVVTAGAFDGRMGVFIRDLKSNALVSNGRLADAPTDSSTLLVPFLSTDLCRQGNACLSDAHPHITYATYGFGIFGVSGVDNDQADNAGRFNPWTPAISNGDFQSLAPGATSTSAVTIDADEWAATPAAGVMVVTTDNAAGSAEAAALTFVLK
jgi:hypothetical protein